MQASYTVQDVLNAMADLNMQRDETERSIAETNKSHGEQVQLLSQASARKAELETERDRLQKREAWLGNRAYDLSRYIKHDATAVIEGSDGEDLRLLMEEMAPES